MIAGKNRICYISFNICQMIKVSITEDNIEVRRALISLISGDENFSCVGSFECAEEALECLKNIECDVALVDIHLPGKSGIELIAALKPLRPGIQFIVLTVFEDTENIYNALKAGATGYLLKGSHLTKILDSIAEVHMGGSPMSGQIARKIINTWVKDANIQVAECSKLSKREQEILHLLAKGFRYKEIGEKLFISTETVRTHIRNIYQKLQVESGIEAINKAFGRKIVD